VGDVEEMANNAITILSDEATLQRFKAAAYEQAKKFDMKNILPLYEELYESVLKKEKV
jgi:L-malate glycosyltransferase